MKIAEIFRSLQGEGKNQGKPCLFIRLAGCNLNCHWCDTPYAQTGGMEMNLDVILEQVWRLNPPYVCITGGEPLLQADDLEPLLVSLHTARNSDRYRDEWHDQLYPVATVRIDLHGCKMPFFRRAEQSRTS